MYASIRTYRDIQNLDELVRRVEAELAPELGDLPGFRGFYVIDCGDGTNLSVSLFETRQAAERSELVAHSWAERNKAGPVGGHFSIRVVGRVVIAVPG